MRRAADDIRPGKRQGKTTRGIPGLLGQAESDLICSKRRRQDIHRNCVGPRPDPRQEGGTSLRIMGAVLVTGGAGFIGSQPGGLLLGEGHRVVVLDNFSSGYRCNVILRPGRDH